MFASNSIFYPSLSKIFLPVSCGDLLGSRPTFQSRFPLYVRETVISGGPCSHCAQRLDARLRGHDGKIWCLQHTTNVIPAKAGIQRKAESFAALTKNLPL